MDQSTVADVVKAYFDRFQALDMAGWRDLFAEEGVTYDPVGNPPSRPHQQAEQFFAMLSRVFASLELSVDQVFVVKNEAAAKWTMRVVGKNGKQAEAEGISTFTLNEAGKIQTVFAYWDDATLMAQLRG